MGKKLNKREAMVEGVFPHPNMADFCCPLCKRGTDKPVVLIPISGTEEGHNCQAEQVHADCLLYALDYWKDEGLFVAKAEF